MSGSILTYTEEEINTFKDNMASENTFPRYKAQGTKKVSRYLPYINRDAKLSVLSLGHFISFSFATEEVKV